MSKFPYVDALRASSAQKEKPFLDEIERQKQSAKDNRHAANLEARARRTMERVLTSKIGAMAASVVMEDVGKELMRKAEEVARLEVNERPHDGDYQLTIHIPAFTVNRIVCRRSLEFGDINEQRGFERVDIELKR